MSAQILDGKQLAKQLKDEIRQQLAVIKEKKGRIPRIVSIMVGDDPSAKSYTVSQQKTAEDLGIEYKLDSRSTNIKSEELINAINGWNALEKTHGIILNKPLPDGLNFQSIVNKIDLNKDIEGVSASNLGGLLLGQKAFGPCTPAAAVALLKSSGVSLQGKTAVVLGRSEIVGKPIALLLLQEDMTVTICHSKTLDLAAVVRNADVVVAAVGKPLFVKSDWIKPGAIVIDVGINSVEGKLVGDVDFDSCKEKASFITPVPGGVGPVTSVMLMKNVVEAFKQSL